MINQYIYNKYAQSLIISLHQYVSVTPVTVISVSYTQAIPSTAHYFVYPAGYESTTQSNRQHEHILFYCVLLIIKFDILCP